MRQSFSATVAADGTATVVIRPRSAELWIIRQLSPILATAPGAATGELTVNGAFVSIFIPQGDAIVEPPPLELYPGDEAALAWANCTPGDVASVTAIFDQVRL